LKNELTLNENPEKGKNRVCGRAYERGRECECVRECESECEGERERKRVI